MRILLYGEGITDVGERGAFSSEEGCYKWKEGTIPRLIKRILHEKCGIDNVEFIFYTHEQVKREIRTGNRHSSGQRRRSKEIPPANEDISFKGHAEMASALIRRANADGEKFDIVGMFKDTDRNQGTKNNFIQAKKKYNEVVSQIEIGLKNEISDEKKNYFAIVPIRILENWLISDSEAICAVNCHGKTPNITNYSKPEEMWGAEVDGSNHPKILLKQELEKCKNNLSHYEKCLIIADKMNFDLVIHKCQSFSDFYEKLITVVNWVNTENSNNC